MLQIVIDTNVLVAAMRSKRGASFRPLDQLGSLKWQPNVTVALLLEYEYVLKRDCGEFELAEEDIDNLLKAFSQHAGLHRQYFLWRPVAADPDDDLVLEAAIASQSDFIVTFNKRDFPESMRFGIFCLTPKEFFTNVREADMKSILLPDEIYERAEELAAQDHVSVDRLVAAVVNEHVSEWSRARQRASQGSLERLKQVLAKVRDVPAEAKDQL